MKFAVSTHIYAADILDRGKLKSLKEGGFDNIELYANIPHFDFRNEAFIRRLSRFIKDLDLSVHSLHAPFFSHIDEAYKGNWLSLSAKDESLRRESVTLVKDAIAVAGYIPFDCIVVHTSAPGGVPELNDRKACESSLDELKKTAEDTGVRIALENIPSTMGGSGELIELADRLGGEHGVCFDTGHSCLEDGLTKSFERLKGRIITTHLHDNDGGSDQHLVPEEGRIAWKKFIAELYNSGYMGPLVFECDYRNSEEDLRKLTRIKIRWQESFT